MRNNMRVNQQKQIKSMRYNELPPRAQKQVTQWIKEQYLKIDEEVRRSSEDVSYHTDEELEAVAIEYLNDRDDFAIEYDEETDTETVVY